MMETDRRDFLEKMLLAAAGALALPGALTGCGESVPASDRVRLGLIGMGGYGTKLVDAFGAVRGCDIAAVCDADTERGEAGGELVEKVTGQRPTVHQDLRELLEDREIDAVAIAVPHHWHALAAVWAMQAGKHVYLEKPVTHNVREGAVLRAAAAKHKRVVQCGTQLRSSTSMAAAVDYMNKGRLGEVKLVKCLAYKRRKSIGGKVVNKPPATVDYDLWSGPAQKLPVEREKFHYDWHWLWEYGNGGLGNNGVHRVDLARWSMGLTGLGDSVLSYGGRFGYEDAGETPNTQVVIHQFGERAVLQELRGLPTKGHHEVKNGVLWFGSEGRIAYHKGSATLFDLDGEKIKVFARASDQETHMANFVRAVRAGDPKVLNGGLDEGIWSAALCHVGSACHRVGREVRDSELLAVLEELDCADDTAYTFARMRSHLGGHKVRDRFTMGPLLRFDSERESVIDHPEADALMGRNYRAPYTLPAPEEV
jgi:predicted dehydrogenase